MRQFDDGRVQWDQFMSHCPLAQSVKDLPLDHIKWTIVTDQEKYDSPPPSSSSSYLNTVCFFHPPACMPDKWKPKTSGWQDENLIPGQGPIKWDWSWLPTHRCPPLLWSWPTAPKQEENEMSFGWRERKLEKVAIYSFSLTYGTLKTNPGLLVGMSGAWELYTPL